MNFLDIKISIVWLLVSFVVLPFAGLLFRTSQLQSRKKQIKELEQQMLDSHAEILLLQEQLVSSKNNGSNTVDVKKSDSFTDNSSKGKLKVSSM